ncbi:Outer membrane protein/protective antigen OMA87 [Anaerovibrio sp. JC8]|uniref:BamA/OMP85 family outer membrane protein n=1 Tax=Anaerovibrio sp. JC8 TaxID=1240085 RepID=UPI000A0B48FF|nr:BamA/TamA family outer membrane protein [Anaerovibrio sp. JC8]ORU00957.1 Outer membrane protein/protective antigen OMA87 [Anaerovibrio sp. JC8]
MRFTSKNSKRNIKALAFAVAMTTSLSAAQVVSAEEPVDSAVVFNMKDGKMAAVAENGAMADIRDKQTGATNEDRAGAAENVTNTPDTAAAAKEAAAKWNGERPTDAEVTTAAQALVGKTIMDIKVEGATEDVYNTAKLSLYSKVGDTLTIDGLSKDANNIYETGYFYDLYPSFEEIPEGVIVTYHVFTTPIISDIEITGNSSRESTDKLINAMQLKPGDRLNRVSLQEDLANIKKVYTNDGYIMAKVHDMGIDEYGKISIQVNEGILEGYRVKGLKKTKEKVVVRELRTKVGEPLNKKDVVRSYQRLSKLNYFESIDIKPIPGVEPNACLLEIDLTEKNTGTFGVGAGYSTADGIIGMISVGDTNFRGVGDSIGLSYAMSGSSTDARGWTFSYRKPWLDKKETAGVIKIYNRTYRYNDYNENGDLLEEMLRRAKGFEFGFSRPVSEYSSNSIYFKNSDDTYDAHKSGPIDRSKPGWADWNSKNFGLTRSITLSHTTDTRDNIMYPTDGHNVILAAEFAGLGGDFKYQKYTIDDSVYRKVGRNQIVALRNCYGHSTSDLSYFNKFRIGGQGTLRGYRDDQFRGNSMYVGSLEFRFPLANKIKGALFTDWGAAWNSGWVPKDFHASVGFGVMVDTPVGPIRIDVGHGSQGNRVHFNVGASF